MRNSKNENESRPIQSSSSRGRPRPNLARLELINSLKLENLKISQKHIHKLNLNRVRSPNAINKLQLRLFIMINFKNHPYTNSQTWIDFLNINFMILKRNYD